MKEIMDSPEYKDKLNSCVEDAVKFAARVSAVVAEGSPTEADIKQLQDEYERISESALIAHDSIPDDINHAEPTTTGLKIKGTDGDFMATIRIAMLKALGEGDYDALTPAREFFNKNIGAHDRGLYARRDRVYP